MDDTLTRHHDPILRHWQDAVPNDRLAHLIATPGAAWGTD